MNIRVLGGGIYGCHIATALIADGHTVELHEIADRLFAGASGGIPARVHQGWHYPRSWMTRSACQEHDAEFMSRYGRFTRGVPINVYAVAAHDSYVDFGTYCDVMRAHSMEFITLHDPVEIGLQNVEGAVQTAERHLLVDELRSHFETVLEGHVRFNKPADDPGDWDWTIDCTFCANDAENIDRYEPCLTVLLEGPTDKAVTVMDGPFPSLYPWSEDNGLNSLTSARYTPLDQCRTWGEARGIIDQMSASDIEGQAERMVAQMAFYWPAVRDLYRIADYKLAVRAMPRSASDARLVDIVSQGAGLLRIRAGKIDAVVQAERLIREAMTC